MADLDLGVDVRDAREVRNQSLKDYVNLCQAMGLLDGTLRVEFVHRLD
jgi:hypothetical protein